MHVVSVGNDPLCSMCAGVLPPYQVTALQRQGLVQWRCTSVHVHSMPGVIPKGYGTGTLLL